MVDRTSGKFEPTSFICGTWRKPKLRRIGGAANFIAMAPIAEANVIMPDWNGVMIKTSK